MSVDTSNQLMLLTCQEVSNDWVGILVVAITEGDRDPLYTK